MPAGAAEEEEEEGADEQPEAQPAIVPAFVPGKLTSVPEENGTSAPPSPVPGAS
jgi:hypothetical protein